MDKRILIIEDDRILLEAMKFTLQNKGYYVETAQDGWDALIFLERNKVNLIISDIMMPNISGLSLLSILNEFNFDKIPVIVISELKKANTIKSVMALGAYDFIVKPIDFEQLCRKISFLLQKK
jgi:DNA-binding response OmpR family regulator